MSATSDKPTHAEIVRRRRTDDARRRVASTTNAARTVRPLVSKPRRVAGVGQDSLFNRRRFDLALSARSFLRAPSVALPFIAGWRIASLSIVLLLITMLGRLLTDPQMFINGINLGGANFIPGEEIYAKSGIASLNIFWVDPRAVEAKVESIPGIASATVKIEWPANVTIMVKERVPVLTWVEGEKQWWVDSGGLKFEARTDLAELLPVTQDDVGPGIASGATHVPVEAVQAALQLKQLRPNIELLHYDAEHGLSYQDGRNWRGYFGVGLEMPQKLAVYETLIDNLLSRGIHPTLVSVENLQAPYYRK